MSYSMIYESRAFTIVFIYISFFMTYNVECYRFIFLLFVVPINMILFIGKELSYVI